jgi:uncharacterized YigZ family protein
MLLDDTYRTIDVNSKWIYKEKSSKFISLAIPVNSEVEVNECLRVIKKEFHDANHHCFAYRLGYEKSLYRYSDDGEPSGTAGKTIYGQLLSFDLTNILVVVIRYFGGTKLGVSGLIHAYKTATRNLLTESDIAIKTVNEIFDVRFDYENMNAVMKILKESNAKLLENNFDKKCYIRISIRKSKSGLVIESLKKISNLTYSLIHTI